MRRRGEGKAPLTAVRKAPDAIGLAVLATTFALIALFLPPKRWKANRLGV